MAARELIRKWQGKQDTGEPGILLERLRIVFADPDLGLQSDFMEGQSYFMSSFITKICSAPFPNFTCSIQTWSQKYRKCH